ncbi:MAG: hypothetical protein NWF04_03645 [Candidatus Bathyarchaeota archaeon]|nr:hypothetical protein [Candidatus Bathyarchaeota archaeon]
MSTGQGEVALNDMIRDLLLSMVSAQADANKAFLESIDDLASTNISISYQKNVGAGKKEPRQITGSALAFGVSPVLLHIQSGVIELRTALSLDADKSSGSTTKSKRRAPYLFKAQTVDAKYQNAYSYKTETSSIIRLTVVPVPPSQNLANSIKNAEIKGTAAKL